MARGVRLEDFDPLEQFDLMEAERRGLLIEFGKETIRIMSSAKDSNQAMALIGHLRRIYFIDEEEKEKRRIRKEAEELVRLSQMTFRVVTSPSGAVLEIGGKKK